MDNDSPQDWNFFGTVERLIKATEALIEEHPEKSEIDQDLVQNMVMRLTVIMEDTGGYLAKEELARITLLENRLNSIRARISNDHTSGADAEPDRADSSHNVQRLQRVVS